MELKGKINLFINAHKRADGTTFNTYSCSIGGKNQDGTYTNLSLEVKFDGKEFTEEKLAKLSPDNYYVIEVQSGFLSVRTWADKSGEVRKAPCVVILKGKVLEKKEAKPAPVSEDLPF